MLQLFTRNCGTSGQEDWLVVETWEIPEQSLTVLTNQPWHTSIDALGLDRSWEWIGILCLASKCSNTLPIATCNVWRTRALRACLNPPHDQPPAKNLHWHIHHQKHQQLTTISRKHVKKHSKVDACKSLLPPFGDGATSVHAIKFSAFYSIPVYLIPPRLYSPCLQGYALLGWFAFFNEPLPKLKRWGPQRKCISHAVPKVVSFIVSMCFAVQKQVLIICHTTI